jgi:hypothetical protein
MTASTRPPNELTVFGDALKGINDALRRGVPLKQLEAHLWALSEALAGYYAAHPDAHAAICAQLSPNVVAAIDHMIALAKATGTKQ